MNANEISVKFNGGVPVNGGSNVVVPETSKHVASYGDKGNVEKYCINKNKEVQDGKISSVVGFENEISVVFEILGRKTKSNLLITGEAGVGKTSLINGFVLQLVAGKVPSFLSKSTVYELDLAALASDASYKGEIEDRFKKLIVEMKSMENVILVIESIDKLFDKQSNLFGASSILKQELSKGNLLLICTSSIDGFTKNIETDKEFTSKLEKISIDEPSADASLRILKGAIPTYEKYHKLSIAEPVMEDAIRLAKRYMTEKALPDSAFDLIDRTMSLIRTMNDISTKQLSDFKVELDALKDKKEELGEVGYMKELEWLNSALFSKVSCILLSQLDSDVDFSKIPTSGEREEYLDNVLEKLWPLCENKKEVVESSDVSAVVAKQTGIPLGKVQSKERDRLVNGEKTLKERVIGQDHAVKIILDAVFESRSGLKKKGQPMGAFFFLGPTGTGKTELSKALAAFLFEDESSLIRFDMSEFKEEHSVALLYGAPPGYVGYEEGGLLVNKIRQKPYSVVLFDEIEKAHKSVFDLFLQIIDEGKLHDRLGRVGDFSNALILFTSNIGSKFIVDSFGRGEMPKNNDLMNIMQDHFRPEFLGRLTEIVPFSPITEAMITKIFGIHLKGLLKLLEEQNITLSISDDVKREIAMMGYNPEYGARPIIGIIRQKLRRPLSKMIIAGELKSGDTVEVKTNEGEIEFDVKKQ
ncbi:MAG TPA: type VI secretion system ATPase ClpV [Porphyromonadaceae bacterium]|nr:type VI secretion system ATPase ClpV [Porphyromonadaceae bacterium]